MALFDLTYTNVQNDHPMMVQTNSWYLPKPLLAGKSQQNQTHVQLAGYKGENSLLLNKLV